MVTSTVAIPEEVVMNKIYVVRDQKVMLDEDLAELYGVETRRLNEQVSRNIDRFPHDFMFKLSEKEFGDLKSQFATSSWGGRRKLPNAFTEHGILMLSSVLNSKQAILMNIQIMRIYTRNLFIFLTTTTIKNFRMFLCDLCDVLCGLCVKLCIMQINSTKSLPILNFSLPSPFY